jgi:serine protease inhibitor
MLSKHAVALSAEKQEVNYNDFKDEGYKAFLEKIQSFSSKLTAELTKKYGQNENYVISPLSVYMALSLACECAANETRQEILDAVGVSYDEVNKYARILYAFANEEYTQYNALTDKRNVIAQQILNNSIWLDDSV